MIPAGITVDANAGVIYGFRNRPVGRVDHRGYVTIHIDGGRKTVFAHKLVWNSVHGEVPQGLQINHINGNKADNRIANLEVVTPSENTKHAYLLGLRSAAGENNGRARLTAKDVLLIRASTSSAKTLAEQFQVSQTTIRDIRSKRRWAHVGSSA